MSTDTKDQSTENFSDKALRALDIAFRKLVLERRLINDTLVMWKDGKVCHVPATEIVLPGEATSISCGDLPKAEF